MVSCGFGPVVWLCLVRPCFSSQVSVRGDGCDWSDSGRSVPCTRCRQRPWQASAASAAMICNGHIKSNIKQRDFYRFLVGCWKTHISYTFLTCPSFRVETWLQAPQFAPPLTHWSRWCVVDVFVCFRIAGLEPEAMHCAYVCSTVCICVMCACRTM